MTNESAAGEVKLLPCPHCDGKALMTTHFSSQIECTACHVTTPSYTQKDIVIAIWNTRAIDPAEYDRLKRLGENVKNKIIQLKKDLSYLPATCDDKLVLEKLYIELLESLEK